MFVARLHKASAKRSRFLPTIWGALLTGHVNSRSDRAESAVRVASQTGTAALSARVAIVPPKAPMPTISVRISLFVTIHSILARAAVSYKDRTRLDRQKSAL